MNTAAMSVLTLTKHRSEHLARLIEGLIRSHTAPRELIVVDMGGEWQAPPPHSFPIRVIEMTSAGLPLARARNAAAAAASSDHLLFLDVDCIPMRHLIDSLDDDLTATDAIICGEVRYLGPAELADDWQEESLRSVAQPHPVRRFPSEGLNRESNRGLFWSLLFGIRRSTFLDCGGFDEAYTGYGAEDTDFGFRAQQHGVDLYFSAGAGAFHQHHAVYDPPLQHFSDIVANATRFYRRWGFWPMAGWLEKFTEMGLIEPGSADMRILRTPTAAEIANARTLRRF